MAEMEIFVSTLKLLSEENDLILKLNRAIEWRIKEGVLTISMNKPVDKESVEVIIELMNAKKVVYFNPPDTVEQAIKYYENIVRLAQEYYDEGFAFNESSSYGCKTCGKVLKKGDMVKYVPAGAFPTYRVNSTMPIWQQSYSLAHAKCPP